jgi:hypothetical protein
MRASAYALTRAFGKGSVLPVLGNNDLIPANYLPVTSETPYSRRGVLDTTSNTSQPYLARLASLWYRLGLLIEHAEVESFAHGGYFAREIVPGRLWLLALNTVVYSLALQPVTNSSDPFGQLAWAAASLAAIRAQGRAKAYLVGHNPPTLESYHPGAPSWQERYVTAYESLVGEYTDVIAGHCFGHTHSGELRVLSAAGPGGAPIFSQGSVVPTGKDGVDDSNPTFSLMTYDLDSGAIVDATLWATNLSRDCVASACDNWQPLVPSLRAALRLGTFNNAEAGRFGEALLRDDDLWETYRNRWYKAGVRQVGCDAACRVKQACLVNFALNATKHSLCCAAAVTGGGIPSELSVAN